MEGDCIAVARVVTAAVGSQLAGEWVSASVRAGERGERSLV